MLRLFFKTVSSRNNVCFKLQKRTFLSPAYYCEEVWENRLNSPLLKQVKAEEFYIDLDQRYARSKTISAVDVDILANSVQNPELVDELIDAVHKLRLSAESSNCFESTTHALIRNLIKFNRENDLLGILDDRLNFGVFLSDFEGCYLMDKFWKDKNYTNGARIASQFMLQEDFSHPLVKNLSLLHCFNYLLKPGEWPLREKAEEPEEEVKVRVKYLRNEYFDDHFDLEEPSKIVGKTLWMITKNQTDPLDISFNILGLALYGKLDDAKKVIENAKSNNIKIYKDVLKLLPEDNEVLKLALTLPEASGQVSELLESRVKQSERSQAEKDIALQCEKFTQWEKARNQALKEQEDRLNKAQRIENVKQMQEALKTKETKLWFFENEEAIELAIEAKKVVNKRSWPGKRKKPRKIDENYVPPEVIRRQETKT